MKLLTVLLKETTGLYGLAVNPNARQQLKAIYQDTLQSLQSMPSDSGLRQSVLQITTERLELLNSDQSDLQIEQSLGLGQMEELLEQAKDEKGLVEYIKMHEWNDSK